MSKHVMMLKHHGLHNAGETCTLSDHEADILINLGKAKLVPLDEAGKPTTVLNDTHHDLAAFKAEAQTEFDKLRAAHYTELDKARSDYDIEMNSMRNTLIQLEEDRNAQATEVEKLNAELDAKMAKSKGPMVRAKFKCNGKTPTPTTGEPTAVIVAFDASVDSNGDNVDWSKWTPSGALSMTITNLPAAEKFEIGKDYFLDFNIAK